MNKDLRNMLVWMVFASALVAMAFWQAQVTVAQEAAAKNKALPPPVKTRHAIRPAPAVFTGDPVADYIARCEKGLTDQEIAWILEDFHNAGLDFDWRNPKATVEDLFGLRAAQHRWYRDALVDGLRLTPEQSTQVMANLDELFRNTKREFLAEKAYRSGSSNVWADLDKPFYRDARNLFSDLPSLMMPQPSVPTASPYVPWKLCELTHEQEKLTWKQWFLSIENKNLEISNAQVAELSGGPLFRTISPYFEGYPIDESFQGKSQIPNLVLPLLDQQKLNARIAPGDPFSKPSDNRGLSALENARLLHPCQLKILILIEPDKAEKIQTTLHTAQSSSASRKSEK